MTIFIGGYGNCPRCGSELGIRRCAEDQGFGCKLVCPCLDCATEYDITCKYGHWAWITIPHSPQSCYVWLGDRKLPDLLDSKGGRRIVDLFDEFIPDAKGKSFRITGHECSVFMDYLEDCAGTYSMYVRGAYIPPREELPTEDIDEEEEEE